MSVLDDMTKGIMQQKAEKAAKLTPVKGEEPNTVAQQAAGIPEVSEVFLTNEAVADIAKDLRRQAAVLTEVAGGLDKLTAVITEPPPADTSAALQKAAEKAADEKAAVAFNAAQALQEAETPVEIEDAQRKFEAALEAQKNAAQASVFASADAAVGEVIKTPDGPTPLTPADGGWTCPDHGSASINILTSRKGRVYRACGACSQFEK